MKYGQECEECTKQLTQNNLEICHICTIFLCPDCQINIDDRCYCKECWEDDKKGISTCQVCVDKHDKKYLVECQWCGDQVCLWCMTSRYSGFVDDLCLDCIVIPIVCVKCRFNCSKSDNNWSVKWCNDCWNADKGQKRELNKISWKTN